MPDGPAPRTAFMAARTLDAVAVLPIRGATRRVGTPCPRGTMIIANGLSTTSRETVDTRPNDHPRTL